ncbi:hypothetical protein [Citrobacter braakii]|uniref:Uncharacterized protein n=1 Tax=Citrobacter braakii TaxID=57706 RepID=A0A8I0GBI6_CITBR|nr:hypothetical protein [Citrobacter braakii]MBD3126286.1 hypothetical protein [Citrobacter braakii]
MEKLKYESLMSSGAKEKIENGSWRVLGLTIQDAKNGRIVASLKTVLNDDESCYTPDLFINMHDEIMISQRLLSVQITKESRLIHAGQTRIEEKLDHLISLQYGQLHGEIFDFFSQFENLRVGNEAGAESLLNSGGNLASRLSGIIDTMIANYLGQVELSFDNTQITYSQFSSRKAQDLRYIRVHDLTYPDFQDSWCRVFIGSLIEMFNQLNILSVCFTQELFREYHQSLAALRQKLLSLLDNLVWVVYLPKDQWGDFNHTFTNYRNQVFSRDFSGEWIRDNEASRLERFYKEFSRESLALSYFHKAERHSDNPKRDPSLYKAVSIVLDFIDNIDDLMNRGTHLVEGGINDSDALLMLAEKTFRPIKAIPKA